MHNGLSHYNEMIIYTFIYRPESYYQKVIIDDVDLKTYCIPAKNKYNQLILLYSILSNFIPKIEYSNFL